MEKLYRNLVLASIIIMNIASQSSGLSLSASTGDNDGSSSMNVCYGATINDYANEHIQLDPSGGTLSNAYSGSGSLPSSSISIRDSKGNYAKASRSVSGEAGTTTWNYDWNTYYTYLPTTGNGVGAWLSLTASNAYSIYGSGYASNGEGDIASASTSVGSSSPYTTSSLINYWANPSAFTDEVDVSQSADLATSTGPTKVTGYSNNAEKDYTTLTLSTTTGSISYPMMNIYSSKQSGCTWGYNPRGTQISTSGTGTINALASSSLDKDSSSIDVKVINGEISTTNIGAWSKTGANEQTYASITSAYGDSAEIKSYAKNQYPAQELLSTPVMSGRADFDALRTDNNAFTNSIIDTKAWSNDVDISSSDVGKTALILEPFKAAFGDLYGSVGSDLVKKGYAVTDYSDSGVSWNQVYKMDDATVSLINTHGVIASSTQTWHGMNLVKGDSAGLAISKDLSMQSWVELAPYLTNPNDMMVIAGCDTFKLNADGTRPGADVAKNAKVSGGFEGIPIYASTNRQFLKSFFTSMCADNTANEANLAAAQSVNQRETMLLQGDISYKLT